MSTTAIEMVDAFEQFPLLAMAYYLWIAALLLLISTNSRATSSAIADTWEKLFLVWAFSLVFLFFWAEVAPLGKHTDEWFFFAHIRYAIETAQVSNVPSSLLYLADRPAFFLLNSIISEVAGLQLLPTRSIFLFSFTLLFSAFIYLFNLKYLGKPGHAALATILTLNGSVFIGRLLFGFSPAALGGILTVILLAALVSIGTETTVMAGRKLIVIILLFVVIITHYPSALALIFIILGMLLFAGKRRGDLGLTLLVLSLVMLISWEVYRAVMTPVLTRALFSRMQELSNPEVAFSVILPIGQVNLGEAVPTWTSITYFYWFVLVFGVGLMIAASKLFHLRKLQSVERLEIGGLAGVSLFSLLIGLIYIGGQQATRFLFWGSLFTAPILTRFLLTGRRAQLGLLALGGSLLVFSFPTFLSNNNALGLRFYSEELAAGEFMSKAIGRGEGQSVYVDLTSMPLYLYYLPEASFITEPGDTPFRQNRDSIWLGIDNLMNGFADSNTTATKEKAIFVASKRARGMYLRLSGIDFDDPGWDTIIGKASNSGYRFYDNGLTELYSR